MPEKPKRPLGLECFDIKPIILGGDSLDPKNQVWLTRPEHIAAVRYWNRFIDEMKEDRNK